LRKQPLSIPFVNNQKGCVGLGKTDNMGKEKCRKMPSVENTRFAKMCNNWSWTECRIQLIKVGGESVGDWKAFGVERRGCTTLSEQNEVKHEI